MRLQRTTSSTPTPDASASRRKTVLRAEKLVKVYGKRRVVDGVEFEVGEGEVVGLLGANGAGKTTSFRMTCGLIPTDSGRIILNGLDVTKWPMYRRAREGRLGYLPQDRSTFGELTTEQNLYAAMEYLDYSRKEMKTTCDKLLEQFDLEKVRKTKVGHGGTGGLSGGERRRLEVARALLSHPKILLLDEPFANVDPNTVKEIQDVIRDLSNRGIAVLITDHQVDDTLAITNRSYIINQGRVLCSGKPLEVLQHPDAIKYYFGDKAKASRELIMRQLGLSVDDTRVERDYVDARAVEARDVDDALSRREHESGVGRRSLALDRRPVEFRGDREDSASRARASRLIRRKN